MAAATQSRFNNSKNTKGHCDHCNRDGHTIANCRTLLYYCDYCDKDGHTQDFCRKLHGNNVGSTRGSDSHKSGRGPSQSGRDNRKGQRNNFSSSNCDSTQPAVHATQSRQGAGQSNFPDPNILNGLTPDQYQQLLAAISMVKSQSSSDAFVNAAGLSSLETPWINSVFSKPWILDSRATDHITSDAILFTKSQPSSIPIFNLPTGSSAPITSTSIIPFNQHITLDNVLCVPFV